MHTYESLSGFSWLNLIHSIINFLILGLIIALFVAGFDIYDYENKAA